MSDQSDNFGFSDYPAPGGSFEPGFGPPGGPVSRALPGGMPFTDPSQKGRQAKAKADKPTTKRSLSRYGVAALVALIVLIVALVISVGLAKKTYVVEASTSIPPLSQVTSGELKAISLPSSAIQSGAFSASSSSAAISKALAAIGKESAVYPISAGQQLEPDLFSSSSGGAGSALSPNSRLMSITAATASAVGGALAPGDRVDIVAVYPSGGSPTQATLVASNIPIVAESTVTTAVPQASTSNSNSSQGILSGNPTSSSSSGTGGTGVYVINVSDKLVLTLAIADSSSKLYLVEEGTGANPITAVTETIAQALCTSTGGTTSAPSGTCGS